MDHTVTENFREYWITEPTPEDPDGDIEDEVMQKYSVFLLRIN